MKIRPMLIAAIVCSTAPSAGADQISRVTRSIVDGEAYRGVDFSSTPEKMRTLLPNAFPNLLHPGTKQGIQTYEVRDDADYDCVLLRFRDGTLIEIDLIYFPQRVAELGGVAALKATAIEALGEPATKTDQTLLWDFSKLNRMVVAFDANGKWSLHVYDRARRRVMRDYKDTTAMPDASHLQIVVGPPAPYLPPPRDEIPGPVIKAIRQTALLDHPTSRVTQDYVIGQQVRAFHDIDNYPCPPQMRQRVFEYLVEKIKRDHPNNYDVQLYALDQQVQAFEELIGMTTPKGMATSHFVTLKKDAAHRHPYNYSTQLYVLNRNIDEYLMYRLSGHDGDLILEYVLK